MINIERISSWLKNPHQLQEISEEALQQLAKEHPYFSIPQYFPMLGGYGEKKQMDILLHMHPVNRIQLGNLFQLASELPQVVVIVEAEAVQEEIVEQTIAVETSMITEEAPLTTTLVAEAVNESVDETQQEPPVIAKDEVVEEKPKSETLKEDKRKLAEDILILPASADDYFLQQGIEVSSDMPVMIHETTEEKEKALMVVMSFAEWLKHISSQSKKAKEEEADQKALKTMWQQQKLAAAIQEESEEIPEQVFEMAVNSITSKEELVSESLAMVYAAQGKKVKAIDMYQKLSLLNPEKNAYFAAKIENLQKDL